MPELFAGAGLQVKALATALSVDDLFLRLEADGYFLRVDPTVMPTMMNGAILSEAELALLRQITNVVRLGHLRRVERGNMVLEQGKATTLEDAVVVHCAAAGLARPPQRPIFEAGRLTVQPIMWGFACFQFVQLGVVEAVLANDDEKNRICPPHYLLVEARRFPLGLHGAGRGKSGSPCPSSAGFVGTRFAAQPIAWTGRLQQPPHCRSDSSPHEKCGSGVG